LKVRSRNVSVEQSTIDKTTIVMYNVDMKMLEGMEREERDYGREIAIKIRRAMSAIDRIAEQTLQASLSLTLSQYWVLISLERHDGVAQKAVCRLLGLSPGAVSRQIDALRDKGFITREDNPSCRREHVLTLTVEGRREVAQGATILRREFDRLFETMDPGEKTMLEGSLDTLLEVLHTHHRRTEGGNT
jgi:DNA-binding MarR family transcriptional regulator